MLRAALALLLAVRAAAEPQIYTVLPDLSGTWHNPTSKASSLMSLYRHQPTHSSAAVPNSVYARELGGISFGHCWLVPSYDYGSRQLQHVELTCDGGDRGFVPTHSNHTSSLLINGVAWRRKSVVPAPHNATIHTVRSQHLHGGIIARGCSCE